MARIRTIKPEFWSDEKLGPLDPLTRLVFLGLISQADDTGRLIDSVKLLDGLIFPYSDDTCRGALASLSEIGVVDRGVSTNGQSVIQLVRWEDHQRIDKPNYKSALPAIAISTTRRRKIPDKVRQAVIERDGRVCQLCGVEVKVSKDDKYDSDPTLAEIDHILAVADGGTNDPQNLQLLCLSCNRKKAGDAVRRRNQESSGKGRGKIKEGSTPRSTIYDQRSTTNDHSVLSEPSENPLDEEMTWNQFAAWFRETGHRELWGGESPPEDSTRDNGKQWRIVDDLSICKHMKDQGLPPAEIKAVICHPGQGPRTMKWYHERGEGQRYNEILGEVYKLAG